MKIYELKIPGCNQIVFDVKPDKRGMFFKTFSNDLVQGTSLENFNLKEEFFSISKRNVLRGLHFQMPPCSHNKLVFCISGDVMDVFVDLRKDSPTYKKHEIVFLSGKKPRAIFLPKGMAHGFLVLSEEAIMIYKTDCVYSPEYDSGVLWNSCGIEWECETPNISDRDLSFKKMEELESPFEYV